MNLNECTGDRKSDGGYGLQTSCAFLTGNYVWPQSVFLRLPLIWDLSSYNYFLF